MYRSLEENIRNLIELDFSNNDRITEILSILAEDNFSVNISNVVYKETNLRDIITALKNCISLDNKNSLLYLELISEIIKNSKKLENIYTFINDNLIEDSIIFEIGTHIGKDSLRIKKITNSQNFYGFEPDPRNISILKKRGRIDLFKEFSSSALSNKKGESIFYLSSGHPNEFYEDPDMNLDWSASNSLKRPKDHLIDHPWCKFEDRILVRTERLDEFCADRAIEKIDFIWMDVQGAEDLVIEGMSNMLKNIRYIYTEFSDKELYEGSSSKNRILNILGKSWELIKEYENDILIENIEFLK